MVGQEAVDGVLLGLNAAIMAYGQTSTGKTHTMVGVGALSGGIGVEGVGGVEGLGG